MLSIKSSAPPIPGIVAPESLAPASRLNTDSMRSDGMLSAAIGNANTAAFQGTMKSMPNPSRSSQAKSAEAPAEVLAIEADIREFPEESANLVEIGRSMLRRGITRSAIGQIEEALRLAPLNAEALKTIGRYHYRRRERELARRYLIRAREAAPGDTEVLRLLAEIAIHADRPLEARGYLERALRIHPGDRRTRA